MDCAAINLSELITEHACRPPLRRGVRMSNPLLRIGPPTPAVTKLIRRTLSLMDRPLLVTALPPADSLPTAGGRTCKSLIEVLSVLPHELGQLESQVRSELQRLRYTAHPLPAASDAALERLAALVLELNLARLQASCLAGTLATANEPELLSWSAATAERVRRGLRRSAG